MTVRNEIAGGAAQRFKKNKQPRSRLKISLANERIEMSDVCFLNKTTKHWIEYKAKIVF